MLGYLSKSYGRRFAGGLRPIPWRRMAGVTWRQHRVALAGVVLGSVPLDADVPRLPQVLANLLNIAAKFTPDGGVIHMGVRRSGPEVVIAVRDNRVPSDRFTKPTRKAGVPHVEAPAEVLETMLTARIHLDEVTDENGPLRVVPGSHRWGKSLTGEGVVARTLHAARGDVLLMRPLLAHGSVKAAPDTRRHRRVSHLEFAASPVLVDGYAWHDFIPAHAV